MDKWMVDVTTGWISGARRIPSPNRDKRPDGSAIDTIVIHAISLPPGECGGDDIDLLFLNRIDCDRHPFYEQVRDLRVSTHLLVRRDGSVIQYVPFPERAWHAGVSRFDGRERVNDFSIGIELEGSDFMPFEEPQYEVLAEVTLALRAAYPEIRDNRIVGHADIAPGRKSDPGPYFNWERYRQSIEQTV